MGEDLPVFIINRTPDQYEDEKNIRFIEISGIKTIKLAVQFFIIVVFLTR